MTASVFDPVSAIAKAASTRIRRAIDAHPRFAPYVPALALSAIVGGACVRAILAKAGEPAAALDDSFIHLQFAKSIAEGRPFEFVKGEGYSSGATSALWPLLLAPFHLVGLRGVSLLWAVWLLGLIAHAGTAVETFRITRRIAGPAAAAGAFAMCELFGAFAWFAWSGMETVALAWLLMRTARVAGAWCELDAKRDARAAAHLAILGAVTALVRPEGAIASVIAAIALGVFPLEEPANTRTRRRLLALAPLAGVIVVPLVNRAITGHFSSSTTMVKWMAKNPYYSTSQVIQGSLYNVNLLLTNLLDGGDWTAIFLPERSRWPILLGLVAMPFVASRSRAWTHAAFVAMVALGTVIPCTYSTMLWNRVRYIWPFAGAWFVLAACFARGAGDLARVIRPRWTFVTPLLAGLFAGALAMRLPWTISDLATSASAITHQQVALGRWVKENLPEDARVGVNDTGAIAYMGGRRTFDVVGLTTEGEAKYWVAGPGSRFEHYEKLARARLPTHFVVYPGWMACPQVLGRELTRATVTDQSILGSPTKIAYEAKWDLLGSGALPITPPSGLALLDEIDVADLESEAAHQYDLWGATDGHNVVATSSFGYDDEGQPMDGGPAPRTIADGGRRKRVLDRFLTTLPEGRRAVLVIRFASDHEAQPSALVVRAGATTAKITIDAPATTFEERHVELGAGHGRVSIEVTAEPGGARFASFHYWVYAADRAK